MGYVDGFVIALPKKNIDAYIQMAKTAGEIWKKYGALDYKECIGDDLSPNMGDMGGESITTFPELVGLKDDETVVFSYIYFKSRAHRDEVNALVMKDPHMSPETWKDKPMPFEMRRMSYGGFTVAVDA